MYRKKTASLTTIGQQITWLQGDLHKYALVCSVLLYQNSAAAATTTEAFPYTGTKLSATINYCLLRYTTV